MTDDTITCVTCGKPSDPAALSELQCQECWEAQCSQSWWEMLDTMNRSGMLADECEPDWMVIEGVNG